MGRAWFFDDQVELEVWEYKLEPMVLNRRSGAEWCNEHLSMYSDEDLREILKVPADGDYQIIFKGFI